MKTQEHCCCGLGFCEDQKGKTSGSRVEFIHETENISIDLHKPHPSNRLKEYQIVKLKKDLKRWIDKDE